MAVDGVESRRKGEREKTNFIFFSFMQVKIPKLCLPRYTDEDTIE